MGVVPHTISVGREGEPKAAVKVITLATPRGVLVGYDKGMLLEVAGGGLYLRPPGYLSGLLAHFLD